MGRGVFTTSTTATEDDVFRNQIQKWIQQNKDSIPKSVMDEYSAARSEGAANGFEDGQVALQDFVEYEMRSNPEFSNSIISNLPASPLRQAKRRVALLAGLRGLALLALACLVRWEYQPHLAV